MYTGARATPPSDQQYASAEATPEDITEQGLAVDQSAGEAGPAAPAASVVTSTEAPAAMRVSLREADGR